MKRYPQPREPHMPPEIMEDIAWQIFCDLRDAIARQRDRPRQARVAIGNKLVPGFRHEEQRRPIGDSGAHDNRERRRTRVPCTQCRPVSSCRERQEQKRRERQQSARPDRDSFEHGGYAWRIKVVSSG